MKKIFCLLFAVLIALSFAGCAENTYSKLPKEYPPDENICFVTEKEEYPKGVKEIVFSVRNDGEETIYVEGASWDYTLHKKVDGEWMVVDFKERERLWVDIGPWQLQSGETMKDSIETDCFKAPLDCGEYRVALNGYYPIERDEGLFPIYDMELYRYVSESFFIN